MTTPGPRMPGSYDMGPLHLMSPSHPAPAPSADPDIEEEDRAWSPADYMRSDLVLTIIIMNNGLFSGC